jgi:hypothetical protein
MKIDSSLGFDQYRSLALFYFYFRVFGYLVVILFVCLFVCLFVRDRVLLCSPSWPQVCDPPASIAQVLGLQICASTL